ncbi:MAG: hypothetical protein ACRDRK_21985 [Pseudonocardia sp.]
MSVDTSEGGPPPIDDAPAAGPPESGTSPGDGSVDDLEVAIDPDDDLEETGSSSERPSSGDGEQPWGPHADADDNSQPVAAEQAEERLNPGAPDADHPAVDEPTVAQNAEPPGGDAGGGEGSLPSAEQGPGHDGAAPPEVDDPRLETPSVSAGGEAEAVEDTRASSTTDEPASAEPEVVGPGAPEPDDIGAARGHDKGDPERPTEDAVGTEPEAEHDPEASTDATDDPGPVPGVEANGTPAPDDAQDAVPDCDSADLIEAGRPAEADGTTVSEPSDSGEPDAVQSVHHESSEPSTSIQERLERTLSFVDEMLNTQQGANLIGWVDREVFHNAEAIARHAAAERPTPSAAGDRDVSTPADDIASATQEHPSPADATIDNAPPSADEPLESPVPTWPEPDEAGPASPDPDIPVPPREDEPSGGGHPPRPPDTGRATDPPNRTRTEWQALLDGRFGATQSKNTFVDWVPVAERIKDANLPTSMAELGSATAAAGEAVESNADAVSAKIGSTTGEVFETAAGLTNPAVDVTALATQVTEAITDHPDKVEEFGRRAEDAGNALQDASDVPGVGGVGAVALALGFVATYPDVCREYPQMAFHDFVDLFKRILHRE